MGKALNIVICQTIYACSYIFFPRVILYTFFLFLLICGALGFGALGLGSYIGLSGLGFGACGVEPSGFFGYGALYINIKE